MPIKRLNDWRKKSPGIAMLLFVFLVLGSLSGAASGFEAARWWVWRGEFESRNKEVDLKFADIRAWQKRASYQQNQLRIDVLRGQLFVVESEIRKLVAANKTVPDSSYREQQKLRNGIRLLEGATNHGGVQP